MSYYNSSEYCMKFWPNQSTVYSYHCLIFISNSKPLYFQELQIAPVTLPTEECTPIRKSSSLLSLDVFNILGSIQSGVKSQFNQSLSSLTSAVGTSFVPTKNLAGDLLHPSFAREILTPNNIASVKQIAVQRKLSDQDPPDGKKLDFVAVPSSSRRRGSRAFIGDYSYFLFLHKRTLII